MTCIFSEVVGYNHTTKLWTMQPYNQSGEKMGRPDDEQASNVYVLPPPGRHVVKSNGEHFKVGSYCKATQSVLLDEVDEVDVSLTEEKLPEPTEIDKGFKHNFKV